MTDVEVVQDFLQDLQMGNPDADLVLDNLGGYLQMNGRSRVWRLTIRVKDGNVDIRAQGNLDKGTAADIKRLLADHFEKYGEN